MKLKLTNFSLRFPWIIILLTLIATVIGGTQFPQVRFDSGWCSKYVVAKYRTP